MPEYLLPELVVDPLFPQPARGVLPELVEVEAWHRATVDLVHCVSIATLASVPGQTWVANELPRIEAAARGYGAGLVARLRRPDLEPRFSVDIDDPRGAVLRRIDDHGHDLVAVGSHGRGGLSRLALGSVSEGILRHAACSVLITR